MMKLRMLCVILMVVGLAGAPAGAGLIAMFDGTSANTSPSGKVMTLYDQAAAGGNNDAQGLAPAVGAPDTRPLLVDEVMPNGQAMKVLNFDGANDTLTIGGNAAFDGTNRTWAVVVKADSLADNPLLFSGAYTSGSSSFGNRYMWDFWIDGDSYRARARNAAGSSKAADSNYGNADEWTIVIGTWQGGNNLRAWVYALEDESLTLHYRAQSGMDANPQGHVRTRIGSNADATPGNFFDGMIAEARYYDGNMGLADVTALAEELQAKYVPEPTSMLMLGLGGMALLRRKRS